MSHQQELTYIITKGRRGIGTPIAQFILNLTNSVDSDRLPGVTNLEALPVLQDELFGSAINCGRYVVYLEYLSKMCDHYGDQAVLDAVDWTFLINNVHYVFSA